QSRGGRRRGGGGAERIAASSHTELFVAFSRQVVITPIPHFGEGATAIPNRLTLHNPGRSYSCRSHRPRPPVPHGGQPPRPRGVPSRLPRGGRGARTPRS